MRKLAGLALVLLLSSCGWNDWLAKNVKVEDYTPALRQVIASNPDPAWQRAATRAAFTLVNTQEVVVDNNCTDDDYCIQQLGDVEFWMNHEYGHIVYVLVGQWLGSSDANQEQGAQCVAEVLTSRPPNFTAEGGYWNCPDDQVVLARAMMIWFHIIDPTEFPIP